MCHSPRKLYLESLFPGGYEFEFTKRFVIECLQFSENNLVCEIYAPK